MIGSGTYLRREGFYEDLLAAYSALDHETTAGLDADAVRSAASRTLCRLAALMAVHDDTAPERFMADMVRAEREGWDVTALVATYLEGGDIRRGLERHQWELQQELVHFSRIVDVDVLDLDDAAAERALARLAGSNRIPDGLKVLSELMIVARSRLLQRNVTVEMPYLRSAVSTGAQPDDETTVAVSAEQDHLLVVSSPRRRTHRQTAYMFSALLNYLTPVEAAYALWADAAGEARSHPIELLLVVTEDCGRRRSVHWSHDGATVVPRDASPASWCSTHLPTVAELDETGRVITLATTPIRLDYAVGAEALDVELGTAEWRQRARLERPVARRPRSRAGMAARAEELLRGYRGPDVLSIECGHIHLDRALDLDQEVGVHLGAAAIDALADRQTNRPVVVPMMDDDHVLVRLTPAEYQVFMAQRLSDETMWFVPESSPIVRSIVCALWSRYQCGTSTDRHGRRGGNVFLRLPTGSQCELFEDYDGQAATGCVLFECALLVYRSAVELFDGYFRHRFDLQVGVHERACALLSIDEPHDRKVERVAGFYRQFSEVTDPRNPDPGIVGLVDHMLAGPEAPFVHLNVLEDYYEVQQDKVRALLDTLGLPVRLLTLSFSAQTGRVSLRG